MSGSHDAVLDETFNQTVENIKTLYGRSEGKGRKLWIFTFCLFSSFSLFDLSSSGKDLIQSDFDFMNNCVVY